MIIEEYIMPMPNAEACEWINMVWGSSQYTIHDILLGRDKEAVRQCLKELHGTFFDADDLAI